ncbi:hypothetical protein Hanom_Chr14g01272781 [Helianthus anomalus]
MVEEVTSLSFMCVKKMYGLTWEKWILLTEKKSPANSSGNPSNWLRKSFKKIDTRSFVNRSKKKS